LGRRAPINHRRRPSSRHEPVASSPGGKLELGSETGWGLSCCSPASAIIKTPPDSIWAQVGRQPAGRRHELGLDETVCTRAAPIVCPAGLAAAPWAPFKSN